MEDFTMSIEIRQNETDKIERIGNGLFQFDFLHAKGLGFVMEQEDHYEILKASPMYLGTKGDLYINTSNILYSALQTSCLMLNALSIEQLMQLYKDYDSQYPDVADMKDIYQYSDELEQCKALNKIIVKVELLRRERNLPTVQSLLKMLLH
jgi:hypothetical protein